MLGGGGWRGAEEGTRSNEGSFKNELSVRDFARVQRFNVNKRNTQTKISLRNTVQIFLRGKFYGLSSEFRRPLNWIVVNCSILGHLNSIYSYLSPTSLCHPKPCLLTFCQYKRTSDGYQVRFVFTRNNGHLRCCHASNVNSR